MIHVGFHRGSPDRAAPVAVNDSEIVLYDVSHHESRVIVTAYAVGYPSLTIMIISSDPPAGPGHWATGLGLSCSDNDDDCHDTIIQRHVKFKFDSGLGQT